MYTAATNDHAATEGPAAPGPDAAAAFDALAAEVDGAAGTGTAAAPAGPDAVPDLPTRDAVALFLGPLFQLLAPAWAIQPAEVDALADAYAPVIDKYFPGGMGVEGGALLVTAAVLAPRLGTPRKLPEKSDPPPARAPAPRETAPAPSAEPSMAEVAPAPSAPAPVPAPDPIPKPPGKARGPKRTPLKTRPAP